jgi:hypothetical protein
MFGESEPKIREIFRWVPSSVQGDHWEDRERIEERENKRDLLRIHASAFRAARFNSA